REQRRLPRHHLWLVQR
ncbi:hypothetical protein BN1723_020679, partial [Verticillium longisporum]